MSRQFGSVLVAVLVCSEDQAIDQSRLHLQQQKFLTRWGILLAQHHHRTCGKKPTHVLPAAHKNHSMSLLRHTLCPDFLETDLLLTVEGTSLHLEMQPNQDSHSLIKSSACKSLHEVQNYVKLDPSLVLFSIVPCRPWHWVHIPTLLRDYWHDMAGTDLGASETTFEFSSGISKQESTTFIP